MLASLLRLPSLVRAEAACREAARRLLRSVGLAAYEDAAADSMPYGALKRLEIARALAAEPKLLLLDEPAAGLNATEAHEIDALIKRLAAEGTTVVLVEHNMKLVMGVSDRVTVLDRGRKLAEGTPDEVARDPRVVEAYLGAADGAQRSRPCLTCRASNSRYGRIPALAGVSLTVADGELVALVGANGAGKTTLLKALSGVQPVHARHDPLRWPGRRPTAHARQRVQMGIVQVPEGRQVFAPMTVQENLELGAFARGSQDSMSRVFELFPALQDKRHELAGNLSGGQQQMLAIGRALMGEPRLLLLDEPSMGLAPKLVAEIFARVAALKAQGTTILLVDQNARAALSIADRGYVMETGRIVLDGAADELLHDPQVQQAYMGL